MGMTMQQLRDAMKDKKIVVLNVLPELDFLKLHIAGSMSQPLTQDHGVFVQTVEKRFGKSRHFITYCGDVTSAMGANASKILLEHGLKAEVYPGGTAEWNAAGWPVEGTLAGVKAPENGQMGGSRKKINGKGWWDRMATMATRSDGKGTEQSGT